MKNLDEQIGEILRDDELRKLSAKEFIRMFFSKRRQMKNPSFADKYGNYDDADEWYIDYDRYIRDLLKDYLSQTKGGINIFCDITTHPDKIDCYGQPLLTLEQYRARGINTEPICKIKEQTKGGKE